MGDRRLLPTPINPDHGGLDSILGLLKFENRDLGGLADAERRTPVSSTSANIYPGVAVLVKTGEIRLHQACEEVAGEELPAVRVSG